MNQLIRQPGDPLLRGLLWLALGRYLYRFTFHNWYPLRWMILSLFGAKVAPDIRFRRTAEIDRPWNLTVGSQTVVGDRAVLRCRAPITIGAECTISQMAVLSTEVYQPNREGFAPHVGPITIDDHCWIATDTFVMPDVHLHEGVVIGARSLVEKDVSSWTVAAGQPATERQKRKFNGHPSSTQQEQTTGS